jgi:hypothetical protein
MAYGFMYEGDGFIRKGPEPVEVAGKEENVKATAPAKAAKPARRSGGITAFRFTRMVFGR